MQTPRKCGQMPRRSTRGQVQRKKKSGMPTCRQTKLFEEPIYQQYRKRSDWRLQLFGEHRAGEKKGRFNHHWSGRLGRIVILELAGDWQRGTLLPGQISCERGSKPPAQLLSEGPFSESESRQTVRKNRQVTAPARLKRREKVSRRKNILVPCEG